MSTCPCIEAMRQRVTDETEDPHPKGPFESSTTLTKDGHIGVLANLTIKGRKTKNGHPGTGAVVTYRAKVSFCPFCGGKLTDEASTQEPQAIALRDGDDPRSQARGLSLLLLDSVREEGTTHLAAALAIADCLHQNDADRLDTLNTLTKCALVCDRILNTTAPRQIVEIARRIKLLVASISASLTIPSRPSRLRASQEP